MDAIFPHHKPLFEAVHAGKYMKKKGLKESFIKFINILIIYSGNEHEIRRILKSGTSANVRDEYGRSALHVAVKNCNFRKPNTKAL